MSELARIRGLSKTYRSSAGLVEALHEVDADFAAGRITAVVGPSGSGKSTLLRVLAGLEHPSAGAVVACGRDLARGRGLRRYRRESVTFVSQSPADNFLPQLTLAEHAGGRGSLVTALSQGSAASGLFERFGIAHVLGERPRELSGGEQARAAFALALLRGTPLVVADEPTAELDDDSAARLLRALRESAEAGHSFVVATHDADVVAAADAVIRLERGRVVASAPEAPASLVTALSQGKRAGEPVLAADGLVKRFGPVHAVDGASLELGRGELGVLVGRSGSGKSTLLNLLGGFQEPDGGSVRGPGPGWDELAFVPQRFGLLEELTVRGNVELAARVRGTLADDRARVAWLLARLGLDELAERLPRETSIGQQQRTALARALALRPALLLADEPTSHQDAGWHDAVVDLLVETAAGGTACLVATHETALAARGERVWEMHEGHVASR